MVTLLKFNQIEGMAVSVKDFGAVSGSDSTAAFQAAVKACGDLGKALYIPSGVYLLELTSSINIRDTAGNPIRNFRVFGDGNSSVIKYGLSSAKNYESPFSQTGETDNYVFENLCFDFNEARAATRVGSERFHNPAIQLTGGGSGVVIRNVLFKNASVDQPIRLATFSKPATQAEFISKVRIINCSFETFHDGVSGNSQTDISCMFIIGNDIQISGCAFDSGITDLTTKTTKGITGIEVYGENILIGANNISNVNRGHIVGNQHGAGTTKNVHIFDTTYSNVVCIIDMKACEDQAYNITHSGGSYYIDSNAVLSVPTFNMTAFTGGTEPSVDKFAVIGGEFTYDDCPANTSTAYSHFLDSSQGTNLEIRNVSIYGQPTGIFNNEVSNALTTQSLTVKNCKFKNIRTGAVQAGRKRIISWDNSTMDIDSVVVTNNLFENIWDKASRGGTGGTGPIVFTNLNSTGNNRILKDNTVLGVNQMLANSGTGNEGVFTTELEARNDNGTETD